MSTQDSVCFLLLLNPADTVLALLLSALGLIVMDDEGTEEKQLNGEKYGLYIKRLTELFATCIAIHLDSFAKINI